MTSSGSAGTDKEADYIARMAETAAARDPDDTLTDSPETPTEIVEASPSTDAATPPETSAAPPDPVSPSDPPQTAPAVPALDAPATTTGTPVPYAFTVDGSEVAIPGIVRGADGSITIPASALPRFQPYLRDHRAVTKQIQAAKSEVRHWQDEATKRTNRGEKLWEKLTALVEGPEDKLIEFFEKRQQLGPILKAEAEKEDLRQQLTARQTAEQDQATEQQTADLSRQLRETTTQWADYYAKQPAFTGLDPKRIDRLVWDLRHDLWFQADEQGVPEWNIPPHGYGIRHDVLQERLTDLATEVKTREDAIKAATEAAQRNATALAPSGAPPAVSAKATGTPDRVPAKPKTREEYEEHMSRLARG